MGVHLIVFSLWVIATAFNCVTGALFPRPNWNTDGAAEVIPWVAIGLFSLNMYVQYSVGDQYLLDIWLTVIPRLNNLVLLILACMETDARRKEKKRSKAARLSTVNPEKTMDMDV